MGITICFDHRNKHVSQTVEGRFPDPPAPPEGDWAKSLEGLSVEGLLDALCLAIDSADQVYAAKYFLYSKLARDRTNALSAPKGWCGDEMRLVCRRSEESDKRLGLILQEWLKCVRAGVR